MSGGFPNGSKPCTGASAYIVDTDTNMSFKLSDESIVLHVEILSVLKTSNLVLGKVTW